MRGPQVYQSPSRGRAGDRLQQPGERALQPRVVAVHRRQRVPQLREEPGKPRLEGILTAERLPEALVLRPHLGPHHMDVLHGGAARYPRRPNTRGPSVPGVGFCHEMEPAG